MVGVYDRAHDSVFLTCSKGMEDARLQFMAACENAICTEGKVVRPFNLICVRTPGWSVGLNILGSHITTLIKRVLSNNNNRQTNSSSDPPSTKKGRCSTRLFS